MFVIIGDECVIVCCQYVVGFFVGLYIYLDDSGVQGYVVFVKGDDVVICCCKSDGFDGRGVDFSFGNCLL